MSEIILFNLVDCNDFVKTDGVIFPNGKCVMIWRGDVQSIVIHETINDLMKIHCQYGTKILYMKL